jgi:hypothetical protein
MATEHEEDDDLAEIIRAAAEEDEPEVTDAQVEALLADPTFARIAATAVRPYEGVMSEKGLAAARRTLATVFLTDPAAASRLARAREAGPPDASTVRGHATRAPIRRRRGVR